MEEGFPFLKTRKESLIIDGKGVGFLPEEVVEEILLRLPVESLIACKGVCKLWYNLIRNQLFENKHLHLNIKRTNTNTSPSISIFLKRTRTRHEDLQLSLVTISRDDANSTTGGDYLPCAIEQVNLTHFVEIEQLKGFPDYVSCSHCNGIICFFDLRMVDHTVVFCNPALGKFKILHTPCLLSPNFIVAGHGFGCDPRANLYKYVKIFESNVYNPLHVYRAQVYTLGTDSWRQIVAPKQCCLFHQKGVYCKGFYYWINFWTRLPNLVSFDFSEEEFHNIPLPCSITDESGQRILRLAEWSESVVFISSTNKTHSTCLEMWVMVDNSSGVEATSSTYWRKHLTIGPLLERIFKPLEFWKDEELLMETWDKQIVS